MKRAFRISLAANVLLTGAAILLWYRLPVRDAGTLDPRPTATAESDSVVGAAETNEPVEPGLTGFRWSQVESADYHAYMANLERIGCPRQTIRDIISADVHGLYNGKRRDLLREAGAGGARESLEAQLRNLQGEEAAVILALLGPENQDSAPVAENSPAQVVIPHRSSSPNAVPAMPLVFQNVDIAALKLAPDQVEAIGDIQERFIQDLGGTNQDPADPAYRQRWLTAQRNADDMLLGTLGIAQYQMYDIDAASQRQ